MYIKQIVCCYIGIPLENEEQHRILVSRKAYHHIEDGKPVVIFKCESIVNTMFIIFYLLFKGYYDSNNYLPESWKTASILLII